VNDATDTFTASHVYRDNPSGQPTGSFAITGTLTAATGGSATAATSEQVDNVPPTVTALTLNQGTVSVGGTLSVTGSFTDPGVLDTHTVSIAWGDGSNSPATVTEANGDGTFTASHVYLDHPPGVASGAETITATATDKDGGQGSAHTSVVVHDTPPVITALALSNGTINEGSDIVLTGTVTDPNMLTPLFVSIVWGDGSTGTENLAAGATTFSLDHVYLNNPTGIPQGGSFPISATVTDDVGENGRANTRVVVDNVAPTITSLTNNAVNAGVVQPGGSVTVTGTFTDPGLLDTHVLLVDWGDTSKQTTIAVTPGARNFSISHVFTAVGDFYITVQVEDNDGGLSQVALTEAIVGNPVPITFPTTPTPVVITSPTPILLSGAATPVVVATSTTPTPSLSTSPVPIELGYVSGMPSLISSGISLQPDGFASSALPGTDPDDVISLVRGSGIVLSTQYELATMFAPATDAGAPLMFDEDGVDQADGVAWPADFDLSPLVLYDTGEPWAILPATSGLPPARDDL
jgi:hypothetical protein